MRRRFPAYNGPQDGYVPSHVSLAVVPHPYAVSIEDHLKLERMPADTGKASVHSMSTVTTPDGAGQMGLYWTVGNAGDGSYWVAQDGVPPLDDSNAVVLPDPENCDSSSDGA